MGIMRISAINKMTKVLLMCIFLGQLTVSITQSSDVLMTRDDLLPELLQLQQDYCGDVILCGDARHVEPDFEMLVMPCCVPCSCLPTCKALDICCLNYNGSIGDGKETRTATDIDNDNDNETQTATDNYKSSNKTRTELDDDKDEIRKEATEGMPGTDQELLHADRRNSGENEVQIESNTTTEGAPTMEDRLVCVRPQILREQNRYLDSLAYQMIGDCPAELHDTTMDRKCRKRFGNVGFNNIVPVTSDASNITYVNIHCLKCNENTIDELKIKYWKPIITVQSSEYTYQFYKDPDDILSLLLKHQDFSGMRTGNIHFLPPNPEVLQQCQLYDIISCNKTGLWDVYNKTTEQNCISGHSMPVIRRIIGTVRLLFRNAACLYCNEPDESYGKLTIRKGSDCLRQNIFGPRTKFNMTLNLPDLNPLSKLQDQSSLLSNQYIDTTAALALMKQKKECPVGHIAFLDTCREVICPRDHYNKDGYCVPLFVTVTGINLHVKFEITPSQQISPVDRLEFAKTLKNFANSTLGHETSLRYLHLSVWYLPRSNINPEEFYLLNMFLASNGGVLTFEKSLKDVKDFYDSLRTNSKLQQQNGPDVTLQYQFGNRVNFVGRKAISYILGGVSLTHVFTDGVAMEEGLPIMLISETNWCYRTTIMLEETVYLTKNVIMVKNTHIKLNKDQFHRNGSKFIVCVDLLLTSIDETKNVLRKSPTTIKGSVAEADESADDTQWYNSQTIVIAIFIFAMAVITFVFCKIKAKKFKRTLRLFQGAENTNDINAKESFELQETNVPM